MKIHLISFTKYGSELNKKLCEKLSEGEFLCRGYAVKQFALEYGLIPLDENIHQWTKKAFKESQYVVYIGACGIAVRAIAPFVRDKYLDPAVIALDDMGKYIIPLLSGHIGGANALAIQIAKITGGEPVISTATDLHEVFAVDIFAKKNNLVITDRHMVTKISAALLEGKKVILESELPVENAYPKGIVQRTKKDANLRILITTREGHFNEIEVFREQTLKLVPKVLCLGVGCRKGTPSTDLENFLLRVLKEHELSIQSIYAVASIDLKEKEEAITSLTMKYGWPFFTYTAKELEAVPGEYNDSDFVKSVTGVGNICERAAVLGSRYGTLKVGKVVEQGMTLSIARMDRRISFE